LYLILIYLLQQVNKFYLKFNCRKGGERGITMTNEKALKIIEGADVYDLAAAYSEYVAEECNDPDSALYAIDEVDELLYGLSYLDVMNKIFYGDYSPAADFFTFDGYGNIESVQASDVVEFVTFRLDSDDLKAVAAML